MSMSRVGTKKEVGAEAMRSRNLVPRVSEMRHISPPVLDIRMVSGNTVIQRNFIFFTVKKSWLAPTELVHLFRERVCRRTCSA
jgi:hypothetical protein